MKSLTVQCPHCMHLVNISGGQTSGTQVSWDCPQCQQIIALPCTPSMLPQTSDEAPQESATKASEPGPPQMATGRPPSAPTAQSLPAPLAQALEIIAAESTASSSMKNAFVRLYENTWSDRGAHQKFLQIANQQNALALAGKLYGAVLQSLPDDEMALASREKVLQLGMAQLGHLRAAAPRRSRSFNPKKWGIIGGIIFVVLVFSMLFFAVQGLFSGGGASLK